MKERINDEKRLVQRLVNGDEDAFCELYANYKERLIYFAKLFLKSHELAEDIFHDVFTIIWQSRNVIDPNQSFSSYLHTIVRNRILNLIRNIKSEHKLKQYILSHSIDYDESILTTIFQDELKLILTKAVNSLTSRQQEIFRMSRDAHMTHKQIAEKMNISVYTVQEHISLSLKTIKSILLKYPDTFLYLLLIYFT